MRQKILSERLERAEHIVTLGEREIGRQQQLVDVFATLLIGNPSDMRRLRQFREWHEDHVAIRDNVRAELASEMQLVAELAAGEKRFAADNAAPAP